MPSRASVASPALAGEVEGRRVGDGHDGHRAGLHGIRDDEVYGLGIEDVLHREPAIDKINGAIGWRPSLDLDRILADVIEHTRRAPAVELA